VDEGKPISRFAANFIANKLQEFERTAGTTSGRWPELFAQHFTDHVDRLAGRMQRPELREHLFKKAEGTGHYRGHEEGIGRFEYDSRLDALRFNGETPDSWKQVDFEGQWVRKSADERARYVTGYFGEDSRTQNDYPGVQIEKNGVVGPVKWAREQPNAQDAQEFAEGMLDRHLGFEAPRIEPASIKDIMKRQELSEGLGAKVLSKEYKKYIKQSAAVGEGAAKKYGANEPAERELPPPSRSR
jgi:hypothetical protein